MKVFVFQNVPCFGNSLPWINLLVSSKYIIGKVVCDIALKNHLYRSEIIMDLILILVALRKLYFKDQNWFH